MEQSAYYDLQANDQAPRLRKIELIDKVYFGLLNWLSDMDLLALPFFRACFKF
jgi:hypothetical protein